MYEPQHQHFVDLHENSNFGDAKSWLSGEDNSPPTLRRTHSQLSTSGSIAGAAGNVDRVLFNNLVEMVPLVESLMVIDRKTSSSFTRRGSMIYTKTPSRESLYKKIVEPKGRNTTQSIPTKKKRDHGDREKGKNAGNNQDADSFSIFSSRASSTEKDIEELVMLKEQIEDLQRKLSEKDEFLKSAENSRNQVNVVNVQLDELKQKAAEKDSLIKATQTQLSDAKIKLADKQAALEKIQWEAMTSNRKVEKLQEELDSLQGDISSFMTLFEGLTNNESITDAEDYDVKPCYLDYFPDIDDMDEEDMQNMEEARQAYIAAVATIKVKQDEKSIAAAAKARAHLQSFVLRPNNLNRDKEFSSGGISQVPHGAFQH